MNIRDERYEGKEYYVIKFQNSKNSYRELWIDKNSKLIERNINDIVGEFYSEKKIEYTPNIVKEDDVQVSAKGYTVKNKQAEVEKEIAEFMNNGL